MRVSKNRSVPGFRRIVLFLPVFFLPPSGFPGPVSAAGPATLQEDILEAGPGRMRVEIRAGAFRVEKVPAAGASRIACGGCQGREPGSPDLPVHRFDVRTGWAEPTVRITILESEPLPALALAPVPRDLSPTRREYRMDPGLQAAAGRALARHLPVSLERGVPIRGLIIPLALLQADGSLTLLKRVELEITWHPAVTSPLRKPEPRKAEGGPAPGAPASKRSASRRPADLGDRFIRIRIGDRTVDQNGEDRAYAVTFAELAKVSPEMQGGVRIGDLRLYTGPADSLPLAMGALPADPGSHPGRLREIPMEVLDDGDGTWDEGDALRFFGHGTGTWRRIPGARGPVRHAFASDPYAFENHYWLGFAGNAQGTPLRLAPEAPPPPPGAPLAPLAVSYHYLRAEQDLATGGCDAEGHWDPRTGFAWFWHRLSLCGQSADTVLRASQIASPAVASLPDFDRAGGDVRIGFHQTLDPASSRVFGVYMAGRPTALPPVEDTAVQGSWYAWKGPEPGGEAFRIDSLVCSGWAAYLDGYTVAYPRRLVFRGAPLWIYPGEQGRWHAWQVQGGEGLYCLRILDGIADRLWRLDAQGRFADSLAPDADARYLVYREAAPLPEGSLSLEALDPAGRVLRDLWQGEKEGGGLPEYLILTSRSLLDPALALRDFRRGGGRALPLRTSVVLVEDIYRHFSGGRPTPVALRDFLRWALHRWEPRGADRNPLRHVLLFGSGHYDYRGLAASGSKDAAPMHIPPYEGYSGEESIASDDFFGRLDSGEVDYGDGGLDLAIGRLPLRTLAQAAGYLDKVRAYEDPAQSGVWRSRAAWAADDHLQRGSKYNDLDPIFQGHTEDADRLAGALLAKDPGFQVDRVYMLDYPINSSWRKPQAAQDLATLINRGALVVNYVGHSSADQWADEVLLQTGDAAGILDNRGRTGMVNSFSCAAGRNDAFVPGLMETLVCAPGEGAIASLAATRESYPDPNMALAEAFYRQAIPAAGEPGPRTIGLALVDAKNQKAYRDRLNDAKYSLLGEPVLLLRKPALRVEFTRRPDTVRALDCGRLEGTVTGGKGSGFINLKLMAGPTRKEHKLPYPEHDQTAERRGAILYEQTVPYQDGRFSADYLFPVRVPFGDTNARLVAFAWDRELEMEGSAADSGLPILQGAPSASSREACGQGSDGQGPAIHITGCEPREDGGLEFPDRVRLSLPSCLEITVSDSVGGVVAADGPDEGTTLEVPGILDPFHPQPGVDELYRKTYRLPLEAATFRPGSHVLKVTAEDGFGNRSLRLLRLDLTDQPSIQALQAYNVPNPMKRFGTAFYFSALLPDADVTVAQDGQGLPGRAVFEVRIFDQAGRLVKALRKARSGIRWDGRDEWGNRLGNGVYFYTVTARWSRDAELDGQASDARTVSTRRNTLVISR